MRITILVLSFFIVALAPNLNANNETFPPFLDTMPRVFLLNDDNDEFKQLEIDYEYQLLSACNDNMDEAFANWMDMLHKIEDYSEEIAFDLKGVKVWLYVFWDKNGSIKHIAYYLKPNSRNVKTDELTAFFAGFMKSYKLPITSKRKFSHYGGASFPTLPQRAENK